MNVIKIDKRYEEELAGIRRIATAHLPQGEANKVLNKCAKLASYAKKAAAQLERGHYRTAAYDARTNEDIAAQARCKQAVFEAMLAGRHVDLRNASEFHVSQMHTAIAQIRRDIDRKNKYPGLLLCDEWVRPQGTRPFKSYWIDKKEGGS